MNFVHWNSVYWNPSNFVFPLEIQMHIKFPWLQVFDSIDCDHHLDRFMLSNNWKTEEQQKVVAQLIAPSHMSNNKPIILDDSLAN